MSGKTLTQIIDSQRAGLPSAINPLAARWVAVVGLGSLGSLLAENVVRLGFSRAVLIDQDVVDSSNLYRQTLYDKDDVGEPKAIAARERLARLGSTTALVPLVEHLSVWNVNRLLDGCHLVLCAVDNTVGRLAINQYCLDSRTPWSYGGAIGYRGETMLFVPGEGPCYACLGSPRDDARDCSVDGILVSTVMAVASTMIFLALSDDISEVAGRRHTYNGATLRSAEMRMHRNPQCPACADGAASNDRVGTEEWTVDCACGHVTQLVPHEDLQLDLKGIARRYAPASAQVTEWYLRFSLKAPQEVFLWRSGRLVVTNTQNQDKVAKLFRRLTQKGCNP